MTNPARDLDLTGMTWADAHRTLERLQPVIADLLDAIADQNHREAQRPFEGYCHVCDGAWPCPTAAARVAVAAALTGGTDG